MCVPLASTTVVLVSAGIGKFPVVARPVATLLTTVTGAADAAATVVDASAVSSAEVVGFTRGEVKRAMEPAAEETAEEAAAVVAVEKVERRGVVKREEREDGMTVPVAEPVLLVVVEEVEFELAAALFELRLATPNPTPSPIANANASNSSSPSTITAGVRRNHRRLDFVPAVVGESIVSSSAAPMPEPKTAPVPTAGTVLEGYFSPNPTPFTPEWLLPPLAKLGLLSLISYDPAPTPAPGPTPPAAPLSPRGLE